MITNKRNKRNSTRKYRLQPTSRARQLLEQKQWKNYKTNYRAHCRLYRCIECHKSNHNEHENREIYKVVNASFSFVYEEDISKMPDRFKVTKTDAPEIEATFNSILKDDEAAVRGKLLPTEVPVDKKGEPNSICFSRFLSVFHFTACCCCCCCCPPLFFAFPGFERSRFNGLQLFPLFWCR